MIRVKCPKCGYEWDYKGRRMRATCPNCGSMVKIMEVEKWRKSMK